MTSKLEPVIWLRVVVTLAYMKGRTYVRTDVHDVMPIKRNFLTSMGYYIFLTMVPSARAELRYHRLPALLVCSLNDHASAMDTVSARVQLGSASTTTDICALIGLLLSSTGNCYFCPCNFCNLVLLCVF